MIRIRGYWRYGLLWLLLCCLPVPAVASELRSIAVIADRSISGPLSQIILEYSRRKQVAISASFETVQNQEKQIAEGAAYDILITARPKLLESLKQRGLIDIIYSEVPIAGNRLLLVTSATNPFTASLAYEFPLADMINAMNYRPVLILGNPETLLEGTLARDALRRYGVLADLEAYTIYEKELPEIISMVKQANGFSLLYESDVRQFSGLKVVDRVPDEFYSPIIYYAVVLAGENMDDARAFIEFLKQASVQKIYQEYGFSKP